MSKLENRNCVVCGKEFNPYMGIQKYCSKTCRNVVVNAKKREKIKALSSVGKPTKCKICGCEFIKEYSRHVYCSDECKAVGLKQNQQRGNDKAHENHSGRERSRIKRGSKEHTKECVVCGNVFTTWNPNKMTCSEECKRINCKEKQRERSKRRELSPEETHRKYIRHRYGSEENYQKYLAEEAKKKQQQTQRKAEKEASRIHGICIVCGNEFETFNPTQKTCCKECGRKLAYAKKQHRIPKNQIVDKDITLEALYRRDSGVCYLCGGMCDWFDRTVICVGDKYPSIDHIVPVSRGGLHAWNNVRLAHFKCNVDKSDKIIPEAKKMIPANAYEFKREVKQQKKKTLQLTKDNQFLTEYESTAEAERQTGIKQRGIQKCASGGCKSYGGFVWRYA